MTRTTRRAQWPKMLDKPSTFTLISTSDFVIRSGDPAIFAVDVELSTDPEPWLWGGIRIWVGGAVLTDWRGTWLMDVLSSVLSSQRDWGARTNVALHAAGPDRAWALLDAVLYSGECSPEVEAQALDEQWARHEVLGAWLVHGKLFYVGDGTTGWLIAGNTGAEHVVECPPGAVDDVLRELAGHLERLEAAHVRART